MGQDNLRREIVLRTICENQQINEEGAYGSGLGVRPVRLLAEDSLVVLLDEGNTSRHPVVVIRVCTSYLESQQLD